MTTRTLGLVLVVVVAAGCLLVFAPLVLKLLRLGACC
jgi:hypothetical protein